MKLINKIWISTARAIELQFRRALVALAAGRRRVRHRDERAARLQRWRLGEREARAASLQRWRLGEREA
jgi:hypothetical protein